MPAELVSTYELETGRTAGSVVGEQRLKFSRDGALILEVQDGEGDSRIWNALTGELVRRFPAPDFGPFSLPSLPTFSEDGDRLAYGFFPDEDAGIVNLLFLDTDTGDNIPLDRDYTQPISLLKFSPDGRFIFAANPDSDRASLDYGQLIQARSVYPGSSNTWSQTPDGMRIERSSDFGYLTLYGDSIETEWGVSFAPDNCVFADDGHRGAVDFFGSALVWEWPSTQGSTARILMRIPPRTYGASYADMAPGGALILTTGGDGTARIWHSETGSEVVRLDHVRSVLHGSFSPNGSRALTTCADGSIRLWDMETTGVVAEFGTDLSSIAPAVFSDDGFRFAFCDSKGGIQIRGSTTGELLASTEPHVGPVTQLAFVRNRDLLVSASPSEVRVSEAATGRIRCNFDGRLLALSDDHRFLVYRGDTSTTVAEISSGEPLWTIPSEIRVAAFSPDGARLLLQTEESNEVLDFDTTSGVPVGLFASREQWSHLESVAFSADGSRVLLTSSCPQEASGSEIPGCVGKICGSATGNVIADFGKSTALAFSRSGERFVRAQPGGSVTMHASASGEVVAQFNTSGREDARPHAVKFSVDDARLLVCLTNGEVVSWTIDADEKVFLKGHNVPRLKLKAMSADGCRVLTIDTNEACDEVDDDYDYDVATGDSVNESSNHDGLGAIRIWEAATGRALTASPAGVGRARFATFVPGGEQVLALRSDGQVRLWNTASDKVRSLLTPEGVKVETLHVSRDGTAIAGLCDDGAARIWLTSSAHLTAVLDDHETTPEGFHLCADGERAMTVAGSTVRVWKLKDVSEHIGHPASTDTAIAAAKPNAISIVPQGDLSVPHSDRRRLLRRGWLSAAINCPDAWFWNIRKDEVSHAAAVAFSPDSNRVVTAFEDRTIAIRVASTGEEITPLQEVSCVIRSLIFTPDGARVVGGSIGGGAYIWDSSSGELLSFVQLYDATADYPRMSFRRDGEQLLAWLPRNRAAVWSGDLTRQISSLSHDDFAIVCANYSSPDDSAVALCRVLDESKNATGLSLCRWNPESGRMEANVGLNADRSVIRNLESMSLNESGTLLLSGSNDGDIIVWNARSGVELARHNTQRGRGVQLEFSPCGNRIFACGDSNGNLSVRDGTPYLSVFDLWSGQELVQLSVGEKFTFSEILAVCPKGRFVATGAFGKESAGGIRIWAV